MFLSLDPDLEIIREASNGVEAVELTRQIRPDVVLMDLLMPEMDGISATSAIRKEEPEVEEVALTGVLDNGALIGAIKAGAIGYLLKDVDANELCRANHAGAAGQVQHSLQAAEKLLTDAPMLITDETLTKREMEVIRLIAVGWSNKEIALRLYIGETTVKTHVSKHICKIKPGQPHSGSVECGAGGSHFKSLSRYGCS